jgi:hypothetical protein
MHSDLCCRLAPPRPCYRSAFEVPGVLTPHDLAVVPAPLDATGAGGTLVQPALLTDARLPLLLCCRPWRHITLLPICILYAAESLQRYHTLQGRGCWRCWCLRHGTTAATACTNLCLCRQVGCPPASLPACLHVRSQSVPSQPDAEAVAQELLVPPLITSSDQLIRLPFALLQA